MPSRTTLMHGNILSHICFQDGDEQIIAGICVKLESTQVKWNLLCEWYAPLIIQQRRRRKNKKNSAWRRNVSAKLRFFFGTPHHPIHTACHHFGWVWQILSRATNKYQLMVKRAGLSHQVNWQISVFLLISIIECTQSICDVRTKQYDEESDHS